MEREQPQAAKDINYLLWCLDSSENVQPGIDSLSDEQILNVHNRICYMLDLRMSRVRSVISRDKNCIQKISNRFLSASKIEESYPEHTEHLALVKRLSQLKMLMKDKVTTIISLIGEQNSSFRPPIG